MREILFRAKAINRTGYERSNYKNGDWVYGLITKLYNEKYDLPAEMVDTNGISGIEVDYKTIGQYMGNKDKNGKMIFEGDICHFYGGYNYAGCYEMNHVREIKICHESLWYIEEAEYVEVIGNIYDNLEFLEEERE